jgi:hypothetical protein
VSHPSSSYTARIRAGSMIMLVATLVSACSATSTEPLALEIRRTNEIGCVGPAVGDAPPDTLPVLPDGGCAPGFDQVSWW